MKEITGNILAVLLSTAGIITAILIDIYGILQLQSQPKDKLTILIMIMSAIFICTIFLLIFLIDSIMFLLKSGKKKK